MWRLESPWWELVARAAIVYVVLVLLLRVTGKRQVGQLAPFDLVLLLVLSNAVQNSITAGDETLLGGLISAVTLVGLNYLVGVLTFRSRKLEVLLDGRPQILIHDGELFQDVLARNKITRFELDAELRDAGCERVEEVKTAILEINGAITVLPRKRET